MESIGRRGAILRIRSFSIHGGERPGSGRKRQHGRTTDYLALSIYQLRRAGAFKPQARFNAWNDHATAHGWIDGDKLNIVWDGSMAALELQYTPCSFGGYRGWFHCPECTGRAAIIFLGRGTIGCRRCLQLRYPSQSEDWIERSKRLEDSIRRKLGVRRAGRPKGMHQTTYHQLLERALAEDERRSCALDSFVFDNV